MGGRAVPPVSGGGRATARRLPVQLALEVVHVGGVGVQVEARAGGVVRVPRVERGERDVRVRVVDDPGVAGWALVDVARRVLGPHQQLVLPALALHHCQRRRVLTVAPTEWETIQAALEVVFPDARVRAAEGELLIHLRLGGGPGGDVRVRAHRVHRPDMSDGSRLVTRRVHCPHQQRVAPIVLETGQEMRGRAGPPASRSGRATTRRLPVQLAIEAQEVRGIGVEAEGRRRGPRKLLGRHGIRRLDGHVWQVAIHHEVDDGRRGIHVARQVRSARLELVRPCRSERVAAQAGVKARS